MANGKIAPIKKGEDGLQCADVANAKVIDWLNALLAMTVSPEGAGSFSMSKGKCVLTMQAGIEVVVTGSLNGEPAHGVALYKTAPTLF